MDPDKRSPCPPHLLLLPSVVQWTTTQWYKRLEQKNCDYLSRNHDIDSTDFRRIFTGFAVLSVTLPGARGRVWGLYMPLSPPYTLPITSLPSKLTTTFNFATRQRPLLNSSRETSAFDNMVNTYFFCLLNSFNGAQVWTPNTKPSWICPVSSETKPFIVTATHN